MRRLLVCVTQRNVPLPGGGVRDCLDQDWSVFLDRCGIDAAPVPTRTPSPESFLDRLRPDGVILSGGNDVAGSGGDDTAPERDCLESGLLVACAVREIPVLGVCRGMQMLNVFHGGRLRPVSGHAGSTHSLGVVAGSTPLGHPEGHLANSYHNFGMLPLDIGEGLEPLRLAPDGTVEALRHRLLPWYGVMWHPERAYPADAHDIALVRAVFSRLNAWPESP